MIDPTSDLAGKPAYEWHGTLDTVVAAPVADDAAAFLRHYGADITYVNTVPSGHGWISPRGPVPCQDTTTPHPVAGPVCPGGSRGRVGVPGLVQGPGLLVCAAVLTVAAFPLTRQTGHWPL